ncbi:MAG TPA: aminotransferase class I/II-fold pyridoxal phosphate-dependent enzyme [Chitinophagaceae bacterium]|nr:aminotransferase class I/II-fold pyridoxal phosphate-dependent enzyme [Chitinophagaceae bacterium]
MSEKIWLSSPHMGKREMAYVQNAFNSNWIAPVGPHIQGFEQDLQDFVGHDIHAAAVSSGTAALHLALIVLNVKPGDEVICQSMTFSASANPIVYVGATPVFVDSEDKTWNMSPEYLELAIQERQKLGKRIKAIIVVHLYGMPAQMDKIMAISRKYQIPVIEDAAEALGSKFKYRYLGTFGDLGIFSFNGNKIITTSSGGALISRNENLIAKARFLATQAQDPAPHYQHSQIGYNYRMSNICAGIGRGQMEVLRLRIRQRRNNFKFYEKYFSHIKEITLQKEPNDDYFSNHWLTALTVSGDSFTAEDIRLSLLNENIDCRPLWKPMHIQPIFQNMPYYGGDTSERLFNTGLCIPSGSNLLREHLERVAHNIISAVEAAQTV